MSDHVIVQQSHDPNSTPNLLQNATQCYNSSKNIPVETKIKNSSDDQNLPPQSPTTHPAPYPSEEDPFAAPWDQDKGLEPEKVLLKRTKPLTHQQNLAIDLLLTGRSDAAVAQTLGLHRVTLTRWRLYNHVFQAELNRRRQEIYGQAADAVRKTLKRAAKVLQKQLHHEDRLTAFRAARALLQLAGSSHLVRPANSAVAPIDPFEVINNHARITHIQQHSIDPKTDPLYPEDRALAAQNLQFRAMFNPSTRDPDGNTTL